jgi:thioredoxin-dependent peroxiredoxin
LNGIFQQLAYPVLLLGGCVGFILGFRKLLNAKNDDPDYRDQRREGMTSLVIGMFCFSLLISLSVRDFIGASRRAHLPQAGTSAPGFSLPNQEEKTISLESLRGKWVVLYFYPKDFTSGCSVEAHNFQQDLAKYVAKNATIVGVSTDEPGSHKSFCAKEGLNFTLLSDTHHHVITLYGSKMYLGRATFAARNTFLIDPKGVIRKTYANVSPAKHSAEVLGDLEKLEKPTPAVNPE